MTTETAAFSSKANPHYRRLPAAGNEISGHPPIENPAAPASANIPYAEIEP